MDLSENILGKNAAERLRVRIATPVLRVGTDNFTRNDLAKQDCYNYTACGLLTKALNDVLKVKNLREVFDTVSPEAFALPHVGVISLAVLGAAFQAKGIGGDTPLATWTNKHMAKTVTFDAIKHREHQEAAKEAKDKRSRKHARRNQAHRTRVDRFLERSSA